MSIIWKPTREILDNCAITRFRKQVNRDLSIDLKDYRELYEWSVSNLSAFWRLILRFTGICYEGSPSIVIDEDVPIDHLPPWFPNIRLNYAENILLNGKDRDIALIYVVESFKSVKISYKELRHRVFQYATAMRRMGILPGDHVIGIMTNRCETVFAFLACAAIGAVWCCIAPECGVEAIMKKVEQLEPKMIFCISSYVYNRKRHSLASKLEQVKDMTECSMIFVDNQKSMTEFLAGISRVSGKHGVSGTYPVFPVSADLSDFTFERLPFDAPLVVLYTSGTTGEPKGIIHSHGGTLIQHLKEHIIHGDVTGNDVFFYYTSAAWMMWAWSNSVLFTGCTLVLYDGHPLVDDYILFDICEDYGITILGLSAKYVSTIRNGSLSPIKDHHLEKIRTIYSTGSPLDDADFIYLAKHVSSSAMISSITGGTDIISLFAGPVPVLPVRVGYIQAPCLGMALSAYDPEGKEVFDTCGDLVCRRPFPSMPVGFVKDRNHKRYKETYFSTYKNVWYHGDYVKICRKDLSIKMYGRSDGTLNPGGVRIGTAEIYNVVNGSYGVEDSVAVGFKKGSDEEIILFCKMLPGCYLSPTVLDSLYSAIRNKTSPRNVPKWIFGVTDIPYTTNGKKMEKLVKNIVNGEEMSGTEFGSCANRECLGEYKSCALYLKRPSCKL